MTSSTSVHWLLCTVLLIGGNLVSGFYHRGYEPEPIGIYGDASSVYPALVAQQQQSGDGLGLEWLLSEESSPVPRQDNLCQNGYVEHCLVLANQDGEQKALEANQSSQAGDQMAKEFDGMCNVVIRFIDCLNQHYVRCSAPGHQVPESEHQMANVKDLFYQSWSRLCSPEGQIRRRYLQHAKCIKQSLNENNAQEQCQSRFQGYFLSGQFSLDSVDGTIQFGCCAFNEWQHCIDSLIVRQCGHDAMRSVQELVEQASGGLVSSLCDKKTFGRKSKVCMGKKSVSMHKLNALEPSMNATLQKYISIFGDFIDRMPDDEDEDEGTGSSQ